MEDNKKQIIPTVGMGATYIGFTDRHPFTVVGISKSGKRITLRRDTATRTDTNGMSEDQEYEYSPDESGEVLSASLRSDGSWRVVNGSSRIELGYRRKYHDYSF